MVRPRSSIGYHDIANEEMAGIIGPASIPHKINVAINPYESPAKFIYNIK